MSDQTAMLTVCIPPIEKVTSVLAPGCGLFGEELMGGL